MGKRIVIGAVFLLSLTTEAWPQRSEVTIARAYYERGVRHLQAGELALAVAFFSEAIELDAHYAEAYSRRAAAYHQAKNYAKARDDYRTALTLNPEELTALNHLAWLQATCPDAKYRDGTSAIEHATQACQLTNWREQHYIATLAAAYAELGHFPTATTLAMESNDQNLWIYESGKPIREPGLPDTAPRDRRPGPVRAGF